MTLAVIFSDNKNMTKIISVLILFIISQNTFAQIKERSSSSSVYAGMAYKFVYLTDKTVEDAYPFFQLNSGDFMKELDGFIGITFNERYTLEFSPAYLFTNSTGNNGFYFTENSERLFYYSQQTRLNALPLNGRIKFHPFAKTGNNTLEKMYFGLGAGAMYINEEMSNQIFTDESRSDYRGIKTFSNDFWTINYEILLGIASFSKIGVGFELSYRFVPLNQNKSKPLITSVAANFNSANLAANIIYTF